ncbi:DUF2252 family protein [Variovorax sp. RHLX14]|uniref:DUF2252 family protein n=1 Tax=Variovorax sp. RHLX14 TaxID=1259731 RepID=UPI003F44CF8B
MLTQARNLKMARSAHAYVRGNTQRFYEWLETLAPSAVPEGPPIWICGDCHVGNLGPVADVDGNIDIQIRDFDQTVVGNPAHDLIRLGLSLASAARGSDLPGVTTARMIEHMVEGYTDAFAGRRAMTAIPALRQPAAVRHALQDARLRTWRHLAEERVEGAKRSIPHGKRFWPVSADERRSIRALVESPAVRDTITQLHHRDDEAEVTFLDGAYWMKGCSSLGKGRYAVLLDIGRTVAKGRDFCLIDIKEAVQAVAPHAASGPGAAPDIPSMPVDNAERVVAGARAMSPFLGERMTAAHLGRKSVFVRELLPQDLKLEIENLDISEATHTAYYLARVVGAAHARQMDSDVRRHWREVLTRNHSRALEAPSWLWSSVVELVASHERGYLDHCRRHAMETAAV